MIKIALAALAVLGLVGCTHTSVVVVTTTVVKKDLNQGETEPYWPSMLPPMKDVIGQDADDKLKSETYDE